MKRPSARSLAVLLISVAILMPCFWQPRIQAGDFSSHVYNAWLAKEAAASRIAGVYVVRQYTNILFDLLLSWLIGVLGWDAGQKAAASIVVLLFFWGAFACVSKVSGRLAWGWTPVLAILTYGWVFHVGFCNFYLSLGLSLWALVLLWGRSSATEFAGGVVLLMAASTAHMLPVAWAAGAAIYAQVVRRLRPRGRIAIAAAGIGSIIVLRAVIVSRFAYLWFPGQILEISGVDQAWVYGTKYTVVSLVMLLIFILCFALRLHGAGLKTAALDPIFHVYVFTAAGVALIPMRIEIPGYAHALVYISERMSLPAAVALCAFLAATRLPRAVHVVSGVLAALYFSFLFADTRVLNAMEKEVGQAVTQMSPRQRVVIGFSEGASRIDPVIHMIDRACVGRCFSYANYEPSTTQFRVRAAPGNGVVVTNYSDSFALQHRTYSVRASDLPLYQVRFRDERSLSMHAKSLKSGEIVTRIPRQVLPSLWGR
ncbi:MAG: hypothetical protein ABFD60_00345 [Bryobacteraceae bacterium]